MSKTYSVGYGKPPKSTTFKKGKSGNPKGRPKGARSFKTALQHELESAMVIKEQGKKRKVSRMEVLAKRLVTDALNGNPKALTELLRQVNLHLSDLEATAMQDMPAHEEDIALLMKFIANQSNNKEKNDD